MYRSSYIQDRGLRTVFMASILVSVINQLNSLTDGVIVSHLISPDAISAVNLVSPVIMLLDLVLGVLCTGSAVLATRELGMQHYGNVTRIFTVSIITVVLANILFVLCLMPWTDAISRLLTTNRRLLPLVTPYLRWSVIGNIGITMQILLTTFVKIIGIPRPVIKITTVELIANVFLDILLVRVFRLGIEGAAIATALSCVISCLLLVPTLMKPNNMLKVEVPKPTWFTHWLIRTVQNGIPSAINTICMAVLFLFLNTMILKAQGADGMFILTICLQVITLSALVLNGAGQAISSIGGVLLGEGDNVGYRSLVNGLLKKTSVAVMILTVVLLIYPDLLALLFGASGHLEAMSRKPLRMICLIVLPICITSLQNVSFQIMGHRKLSSAANAMILLFVTPAVWLSTEFFPQYFWFSLTVAIWMVLVVTMLCTFVMSRRDRTLHWFTLITVLPNDPPSVSLSVEYSKESLRRALNDIHLFLIVCDLPHDVMYRIDSCIEELTNNLLSMTESTQKDGSFDVRIVDSGTRIMVVMKDDGVPYNPVLKYNCGGEISSKEENLALVMINALCPDINHKYLNGINCTYLNFEYKPKL